MPQIASLKIRGAQPGTIVYVDQEPSAPIGADGNTTIPNIKPGEHTIELRRDGAMTKRFQRTFATGDVLTLSGPDVVLDKVVAVEVKPPDLRRHPRSPRSRIRIRILFNRRENASRRAAVSSCSM